MKRKEITEEINALQNLLAQHDYTGRKVAFEVAEKLKTLIPDVSLPEYEKYMANEEKATQMRTRINELQNLVPDDENEEIL